MQAVMMVAGKSTRTYPLTLTRPKPLLPVLNKPLIYYNLNQLVGLVDEVILIAGYRKEMIENLLGSEYLGMKIIYQEQKEQLGTGHAVLQAKPHIKDPFLVMNGDDLFARDDMEKLLKTDFSALAMKVKDPSLFGVFKVNKKDEIIRLVEKPQEFLGNLANVGCYFFQPSIFSVLENTKPSERGEIEITSAIQEIAESQPVKVVKLEEYWLPTGYPWDLLKTQKFLFEYYFSKKDEGFLEDGVTLEGKVSVGKGTVIKSGTHIIGPVAVAEDCEIGGESVIGPNTSIGNNCAIGEDCRITNSLIMENGKIGQNTQMDNSVIGYSVNIGESCQLISKDPAGKTITSEIKGKRIDTELTELGASIADNVTLGANTIVSPGCKIWPGKMTEKNTKVEQDIRE